MKNLKNLHVLPLYNNPVPAPCSRSARFLAGLLFVSLFVLALVPSLFYYFFNFLFTLFYLALDFYKSETGQVIVTCVKQLVTNYNIFRSTRGLEERMARGDSMVPPFFIWIFQDYPEVSANLLGRLDPVALNMLYDEISDNVLDFVCINNKIFF
jgi:hypothetical protein